MPDEALIQLTKRKGMFNFFERAPHSGLIKRLSEYPPLEQPASHESVW
jgi:hypothetical protein